MTSRNAPPTHPIAFGDELVRLRTSSGLTLEDVMSETKISRRVLEALESGRFQFLPEQVFSRNFVRQYAVLVGGDSERLVEAFDAAWERFQLSSGTHPALCVDEPPPRAPIHWRFWFPIATGGALMAFAALVILWGGRSPGDELMPDPRRPILVRPVGLADPTAVADPQRTIEPEQGAPVPEPVAITVRVDEGKECWIHYRDRDGMTDQRLVRGGEEVLLQLTGPVKFTVGNAGAATVVVGDSEYRNLGVAGQVVHTEVSRDGLTPLRSGNRYD